MKLTPKQAPLYGQCVLTVQLTQEEVAQDGDWTRYFLLFSGSRQSHLTGAVRAGPGLLRAVCPAHDCCEVVGVTLGALRPDRDPRPGRVVPLAEQSFAFVQDLAFDMAQFLVSTAGRADGLEGALLLDECQIPLQECERLDLSLSLALHHLQLPPGWSLLGGVWRGAGEAGAGAGGEEAPLELLSSDAEPRETLLHFSCRRGLLRVTRFLLQQPGARHALRLPNRQGLTPAALAQHRGHAHLLQLLARVEEENTARPEPEPVQRGTRDARLLSNLPTLDSHTLTLSPTCDPATLQRSVELLLRLQGSFALDPESGPGVGAARGPETLPPGRSQDPSPQDRSGGPDPDRPRPDGESGPQDPGPVPPQDRACPGTNREGEETEPVSCDGSEGGGGRVMGQSSSSDGSVQEGPDTPSADDVIRGPDLLLAEGPGPARALEQNREAAGADDAPGPGPEPAPPSAAEPPGADMEEPVGGQRGPEVSGSDDDCSFQSLGSSTTDIYLPTLESASPEHGPGPSGPDQDPSHHGPSPSLDLSSSGESRAGLLPPDEVLQESWAEGSQEVLHSSDETTDGSVSAAPADGEMLELGSEPGGAGVLEEARDWAGEEHGSTIQRDAAAPPALLRSQLSGSAHQPALLADSAPSRDPSSDLDGLLSPDPASDAVFPKGEAAAGDSASEVSVSCSSTDDAASVGPSCSSSPEDGGALSCGWSPEAEPRPGRPAEDEAQDRVAEVPRRPGLLRRSLSPLRRHSWGPGKNQGGAAEMNQRSYSLEGLSGVQDELRGPVTEAGRGPGSSVRHDSDERGSLVSLTEEQEEGPEAPGPDSQKSRRYRPLRSSCSPMTLPLTKSVSMLTISHRDIDGMKSYGSTSGSVAYSISEEEPGPPRAEPRTKVGRTFSYIKNKMYKKTREKEREKKEAKEKKSLNGHQFWAGSSAALCSLCTRSLSSREALHCAQCSSSVHKGCRDNLPPCSQVRTKAPPPPECSTFPTVTLRKKTGVTRDRPWSAILSPDDHSSLLIPSSRRHTSIMGFHGNSMAKSLSISNIAGPVLDEMPIRGLRYLSQSSDSLHRSAAVTESMESLTDEGAEMMEAQLMGELEAEARELESDSWSLGVEAHVLQRLDKELVKRQDVIYELMQTEMHHVRTLRIMAEVYSKGLQKEVQVEPQSLERLFPVLDPLLELHTLFLSRLLERRRHGLLEGQGPEGVCVVRRVGDLLLSQFSDCDGEQMKKTYGRFCSRHSEAVGWYKELLAKEKRFKSFIKKKMSSSVVRRLGIPACLLLVTQRITKYPVLIQRLLQHTTEEHEDHEDLKEALRRVKDLIGAVDAKVNEHEKRRRLKDFHARTDSKSIMMMKSGQMFAREDLLRRRLLHDGPLQLKSGQGRLKDVHALLLSDAMVFLQEKDQRYVFAQLDQRSTVISLQKLIVREVASRERGLFLISAGVAKPEMVEVLASSREERNTWMQLIQEAMQSLEKDEDEGIPSDTEEDKRQLESKAREMRDLLKQKDTEIMSLLEEKVRLFRGMWDGGSLGEDLLRQTQPFFRSTSSLEPPRGASIMKEALQEVETLQALVNGGVGGAMAGAPAGAVCLPRRAETFGGFDSHQMHGSKSGEREESEDSMGELRRTESDGVLKKGGNNNLLLLLKRNSEQVLHSVSSLHLLLSSLQAVVLQQDSFIEDQRQALTERSSPGAGSGRGPARPGSLAEQEKQRSLEQQRQEATALQRQQVALSEERRRKETEWEIRDQNLSHKEALLLLQEQEAGRQRTQLEAELQELQRSKDQYQRDLERLRDAQRKLDRDRQAVQRQLDAVQELRPPAQRTSSSASDEVRLPGTSLVLDPLDAPAVPALPPPPPSRPKGRSLNPFASSQSSLLQLKSKERRKKKSSRAGSTLADAQHLPEAPLDGEIFFC